MNLSAIITFKTNKEESDFYKDEFHPQTRGLAISYADRFYRERHKRLIITNIIRTKEEQIAHYKKMLDSGQISLDKILKYPHLVRRDEAENMVFPAYAFDQSISNMTAEDIAWTLEWGNSWWRRPDGKQTCYKHDVGSGDHIHWQFTTNIPV